MSPSRTRCTESGQASREPDTAAGGKRDPSRHDQKQLRNFVVSDHFNVGENGGDKALPFGNYPDAPWMRGCQYWMLGKVAQIRVQVARFMPEGWLSYWDKGPGRLLRLHSAVLPNSISHHASVSRQGRRAKPGPVKQ